ncbi:choice-of-anchor L domain-containing protein [Psychroserpens sp. Hel_I_66]|uniref:choice-of-anchor L domain-containing protein n=1 Tax=Psychroserpens sp. Hel_I_66 TaxID=1250004 RepID=UPI00068BF417|nr:choice-of-anchor L domain-containing protein [Psychroserpens sp. Hel_I_66]
MKNITLLIALLFTCSWVSAQTYLQEDFNTEIPATWTITDGGGATGDSWMSAQQGGGNSLDGTNGALVDSDANGNGTELIETLTSPTFDTTGATALFLDFDQYYFDLAGGADSDIGIVEVFDGTNWIEVLNQDASAGGFDAATDQQHIDITAYSNAAMQIRFIYDDGNSWAFYWLIDNIQVYNSTCNFPSDITVSAITSTSAEISWTAGGAEMDWEVAVQPAGSGEPTGAGTMTNNNPYTIDTLSPVTEYDVYVRADCDADGLSIWAGPVTFQSACDVFTPEYLENFGTIIPDCWDEADNGDATTGPENLGAGAWGPDGFLNNGFAGAYKINLWQANKSDWILTPQFDLTGGPFQVDFDFGIMVFGSNTTAGTLGSDDFVQLLISNDNGATWTPLITFDSTSTVPATGTQVVQDLTAYSGQIVQFGILGSEGTVDDTADNDVFVDNFRVREIPTCPEPTGLTVDNITAFTADISWTAGGAEMDWEVAVQPVGTGLPTGPGTPTQDNPYTAMTLTAVTEYEVWVRADCIGEGLSSWVGPVNFETGCDIFIPDYLETFTDIIPDCWDEAANGDAASGPTGLGAGDWGPDGFLNNGFAGAYKINLWLAAKSDWILSPQFDLTGGPFQVDFDFGIMQFGSTTTAGTLGSDDTVQLLISNDNGATWTSLITFDNTSTVPATGTQVVFDLTAYSGQIVQFGILGSEGTVDDPEDNDVFVDNFRVRAIPSCQEPTNLAVSNVTGDSVDITWNAGGPETDWEYVVIPAGSGPPTGSGTSTTLTAITESGLDFDTDYEVWVRANCDAEGFSTWVGPVEFTTTIQTDFEVDCTAGILPGFLCYGNNDSLILTYTSADGTPLNLSFLAGEVEGAPFDFLVVYDTDGSELYNDEGDDGDISGLTFQSTGDTISFQITSDISVSCDSGSFCCSDGIDFTVACATCINPAATYQIIDDCDTGDQFLVDVNVTTLGDAISLTISNNVNGDTTPVTATGIYQVGPFPFATDVIITLSNDQDSNCIINSSAIRLEACPPDNDNPCDATVAAVNADDSCALITSGTLLEATDSGIPDGTCGGNPDDDVWFQFTALEEFQIIQLTNIDGTGFGINLDHALYEGTCDAPVELYCSADDASLTTSLTVGNTYYIRVFSAGDVGVDYTFDLCIRPGSGNVSIDQTTYTIEQLVVDILIDSPCAQISNITSSTGSDFGDVNGIGYFSADEGSFPFEDGILLTSGNAALAGGPNFNAMSDGGFAWVGDTELDDAVGINSNNASIIEFDFVPLSDDISFDFIMASEEYNGSTGGTFECTFSDAFAFLLTDQAGNTTNLAVLPGTTTPILVTNIHPENPGCPAINEEFFGGYIPQNLPPISFDGRTTVFTAFSPVNIGETYHIKLVIADASDTALDSGVFLKAGSFDIGEVELGADITVAAGTAACVGEQVILETQALTVDHVWFKDGFQIEGETSNTLVVTEDGTYTAQIIFSPSCIISDEILVEFLPSPEVNTPDDNIICSATGQAVFDLNSNDAFILGPSQSPADFTVTYHISQDDADNDDAELTSPYTNTTNPETIFVRVENNVTGCFDTTSFNLVVEDPSFTIQSVDVIGCDNDDDGIAEFDIDSNTANVLGDLDPSQYDVSYYLNEADAIDGLDELVSPYESAGGPIFVRVETVGNPNCFVVGTFNLVFGLDPSTSFTTDFNYEVCPDAVVPIIIEATPENYDTTEVSISWFYALDGSATPELISGENGLTLPVLDGGIYTIEVTFNDTGCTTSQSQEVIELESCFIPQGISPNGDGLNDSFDLSNFRVTRLEIFNRYGTSVYQKTNYIDEWVGQSDKGDELPVGTYFYSVEFEDKESETGWVYLQKEQ